MFVHFSPLFRGCGSIVSSDLIWLFSAEPRWTCNMQKLGAIWLPSSWKIHSLHWIMFPSFRVNIPKKSFKPPTRKNTDFDFSHNWFCLQIRGPSIPLNKYLHLKDHRDWFWDIITYVGLRDQNSYHARTPVESLLYQLVGLNVGQICGCVTLVMSWDCQKQIITAFYI